MGSRVRLDPEHMYEVFLELAKPIQPKEEPYILQIFPETYNDEEVLKSVPKFAFPSLSDESTKAGEHFTFVLTDIESRFKFGFCRISLQTQTCICIISCLPWYEIFYKLLDSISDQLSSSQSIVPFLHTLYLTQSFKPGENVAVTIYGNEKHHFSCPLPNQLPSLPDNKNLLELCNRLDVNNMMIIFASMLYERRILVVSQSLNSLTASIPGAALLLHPMNWQHLYIPVLPPHLLDYCSAPMPYLIGLHSSVMKKTKVQELGDTVILNLDKNSVESEYDDLALLPDEVVSALKRHLKQQDKMHGNQLAGDGVARAFLRAMVALIGGYRDALRFRPGEPITFDPDAFVISRPANMQPFLRKILQLQTFQQFVSDRLDLLNAGEGFKDDFDIEASLYSDRWGTQSRYKDWVNHMKKQGKKLRREGKDRWIEFTAKVKDRSKKTFKDLSSRIEEVKKEEDSNVNHSPKSSEIFVQPHRPPRPPPPNISHALGPVPTPRVSTIRRKSLEKVQHYHPVMGDNDSLNEVNQMKPDRLSVDDTDLMFNPWRRINTDLLADPDIQMAFRKSYSLEELNASPEHDGLVADDDTDGTVLWDHLSEQIPLGNENWLDVNSDLSLNSKSSGSVTGTGSITSSSDICRARPVPSHRQSLEIVNIPVEYSGQLDGSAKPVNWTAAEQSLITLDTSSSNSVNSLETIEFDPLKKQTQDQRSKLNESGQEKSSTPVPKPRLSKAARVLAASQKSEVGSCSSPDILLRKGPSLLSFETQSIREARAAFMQADGTKPIITQRQESLDQFDPLASGQLVVDMPLDFSGLNMVQDEDNLLKEWNLDFNKIRQISGHGGRLNDPAGTSFSSMPNLFPSQKGYYPSSAVGSSSFVGYPPAVNIQPQVNQHVVGGSSVAMRLPRLMKPQMHGAVPVNHPFIQQPQIVTVPGTDFSGRSATLPVNSALNPSLFNRDTNEVSYASVQPNASSSGQLAADLWFGGHNSKLCDPALKPRQVDLVSQNNNQWEKFE